MLVSPPPVTVGIAKVGCWEVGSGEQILIVNGHTEGQGGLDECKAVVDVLNTVLVTDLLKCNDDGSPYPSSQFRAIEPSNCKAAAEVLNTHRESAEGTRPGYLTDPCQPQYAPKCGVTCVSGFAIGFDLKGDFWKKNLEYCEDAVVAINNILTATTTASTASTASTVTTASATTITTAITATTATTITTTTATTATTTSTTASTTITQTTTTATTTTIYDPDNADCTEKQDPCSAACEDGTNRNYAIISEPIKNGKACAGPTDCVPGQDDCPPTTTTSTTSTTAVSTRENGNSNTNGNSNSSSSTTTTTTNDDDDDAGSRGDDNDERSINGGNTNDDNGDNGDRGGGDGEGGGGSSSAGTVATAIVVTLLILAGGAAAFIYRAKAKRESARAFNFEHHLKTLHAEQLAVRAEVRAEELQAHVAAGENSSSSSTTTGASPPRVLPPLPPPRIKEIRREDLLKKDVLGSGNFGEVWKCTLHGAVVAAKIVKINESKVATLSEIEKKAKLYKENVSLGNEATVMMVLGNHPYVVELIGVVRKKGPLMVVLKAEGGGDLKNLLGKIETARRQSGKPVDFAEKTRWVHEIADGMKHIAGKHIVHRDLASRNIMISAEGTCRIADFGE